MSIAAIATTAAGLRCLAPVCQSLGADPWGGIALTAEAQTLGLPLQTYPESLKAWLIQNWQRYDSFVFCLATGAVVRLIAPLLQDKTTDPAVVVIDPAGHYAISLCGGHQGGADRLTQQVSHCLDAQPVITGAAQHLNLPGLDILGVPFGWTQGSGDWTTVSAAIANGQPVEVLQEVGSELWQQHLPDGHSFQFDLPEPQDDRPPAAARVWISPIQRQFAAGAAKVQWHPRVLHVGIGCERGVSQELIELAIADTCRKHHLAVGAIATLASATIKADEIGLLALSEERNWPLQCFSPEQLKTIDVPTPSAVVEKEVGTPSVAEAAAILAAGPESPANLRVKKQIFRKAGYQGAVTVAIAQSDQEYTGRTGQLFLVGTGPGNLNQITPAAKNAISRADVVIGYSLYMDLIRPLLRPGQIIEAMPITQEQRRADRAIELANWGLSVAMISSGDCGIYAMGGLVFETLKSTGWDGQTPAIEVFPGISALQSAASRVGAPLMHDFCAISLSDLLTPWEMIQKRLQAAAAGDFIVALYNPKSRTRTQQIVFARDTLLQHRSPHTPVALARSLYREDEAITLTTLGEMLDHPIDMLTTVLIGNQSSFTHKGWMITPRGYLGGLSQP